MQESEGALNMPVICSRLAAYMLCIPNICCRHLWSFHLHSRLWLFMSSVCVCLGNKCNLESVDGSSTLGQSVSIKWEKQSFVLPVKRCQLKFKLIGNFRQKEKTKQHTATEKNKNSLHQANCAYIPVQAKSLLSQAMQIF